MRLQGLLHGSGPLTMLLSYTADSYWSTSLDLVVLPQAVRVWLRLFPRWPRSMLFSKGFGLCTLVLQSFTYNDPSFIWSLSFTKSSFNTS